MKQVKKCIVCDSTDFSLLFQKESAHGDKFTLVKCGKCGMEFLSEYPDAEELIGYYKKEYFTQRTERGYNNYFSPELRSEIERVFKLNLEDLKFFKFENDLPGRKTSLDIGCAAGYFVSFMKSRGWESSGIDISQDCVKFAKESGLNVSEGDYLNIDYNHKFNLIALWATIEHLQNPDAVLRKIYNDLQDRGMLYISTCRTGGVNFKKMFGSKWRFYNFPEHIYFFSKKTIKMFLEQNGFKVIKYATYGSNMGKSGTATRKVADFLAKNVYTGDMMIVSARKV